MFQSERLLLVIIFAMLAPLCAIGLGDQGPEITGESKQWHKLTFSFDGPQASETGEANPFYDYRLDVIFTHPSGLRYVVPGFFAADGQAGDTGANDGNVWRTHFTPSRTGTWNYEVHLRKGKDVATTLMDEAPEVGSPVAGIDGLTGSFVVTPSDKTGRDFRSPQFGRLMFKGSKSHFKFSGSMRYFLKAGQGSPETFIAYKDFDDVRDLKGDFIHQYAVHAQHYEETAEPFTWRGGKGKNILGAVNYLAEQGVNSQYAILTTVQGDGDDSWPWVKPDDFTRYDCSKLDQWDRVFTYMNIKGVMLTCLLLETENEQIFDDGAALGAERKVYMREVVARFGHLPVVCWIMSEETRLKSHFPADHNRQRIQHFRKVDPYNNPTGLHNGDINGADYANVPEFDYFSLHASADNWSQAHTKTLFRVNEAKRRGHPWIVFFDECVSAHTGVMLDKDNPDHDEARKHGLWGSLLAGGAGVSWYYGYSQPHADLNCDDFTLRKNLFNQTRIAVDFLQDNHIPYWHMENRNELVDSGRCLAKEGEFYLIQLDGPTYANIYLADSKTYDVRWFDPKKGGELQVGTRSRASGPGTTSLGRPPSDPDHDWITLLSVHEPNNLESVETLTFNDQDGLFVIEAEDFPVTNGWKVETSRKGYTGQGYLVWRGRELFERPGVGATAVNLNVTKPGKYKFVWRNAVGFGDDNTEANDTWLRFPNASKFYSERTQDSGTTRIYPRGSGHAPEPDGSSSDNWFKIYNNGMDWSWGAFTSDHDPHSIYVEFDEPGTYALQISGRSVGHIIDRIVLYHESVDVKKAHSLDHPLSPRK